MQLCTLCYICVAVIDVLALVIAVSFSSVTYLQTQDNIVCTMLIGQGK